MDRVLADPPELTSLYASALAVSARAGLRRRQRPSALPLYRHRLDGLLAAPDEVEKFQRLMGRARGDFLPSGYVHILVFPVAVSVLSRPDFPLPLLGMIHLRNEIHHLRPIRLDERLAVTAWVENLTPHRSGSQVDVVVHVHSGPEMVWMGRSTYLAKGIHLTGTSDADVATAVAADASPAAEELPGCPTAEWSLGGDTGRRYAAVSGDYNPIHLSVLSARALGMKRPIAHGMYLASRMVAAAGPDESTPFKWTVEFRAPVLLPSRVLLSAEVDASSTAQWRGAEVIAWDPRRRRTHFSGSMERLGSGAGAE